MKSLLLGFGLRVVVRVQQRVEQVPQLIDLRANREAALELVADDDTTILPEATLRELGAEHRTFQTVKGAMLWYASQLAARLRVNRDYEWGSTPRSEEERQRTNATFAALAACLKTHGEDPLPGEHIL